MNRSRRCWRCWAQFADERNGTASSHFEPTCHADDLRVGFQCSSNAVEDGVVVTFTASIKPGVGICNAPPGSGTGILLMGRA